MDDDFEADSFVVDNSEVEYESSLDELDMVDEFGSDDDPKRKTRWMTSHDMKGHERTSHDMKNINWHEKHEWTSHNKTWKDMTINEMTSLPNKSIQVHLSSKLFNF